MDKKTLLEWYEDAGVDEAIDDVAIDHFKAAPLEKPVAQPAASSMAGAAMPATIAAGTPAPLHHSPSAAALSARELADKCSTLEELEAAVREFNGCSLKKTASKTVFSDGNPRGAVMIIGEAPGAQEDIQGIPFCGPSGLLLDRMLAAIGLDRKTGVYISNTVFWRPPGNRQPSPEETAICLPFVEKHIALAAPSLLILSGGTAATSLLRKDQSISRLRGKFYDYNNPYLQKPISTMLMYHPSYLLRTPAQKRLAWSDLLMAKEFLTKSAADA